jgi:hypothetical protein
MPPPEPPLNPSQAVERIREIIVGRHLERIEQRVANLETGASTSQTPTAWEDRLCLSEARLEALQQSVERIEETASANSAARSEQQQVEIQRLASQIQQVASMKAATDSAANQKLEQKVGSWLNNWQGSLQKHLVEREQHLAGEIRDEVAMLWQSTESHITKLESRALDHKSIEERFSRIAAAARALAESAAPPLSSGTEYATP